MRQPRKLPSVLNEEEVVRLLENASGLKYRAALGVAYGGRPARIGGRQPEGLRHRRLTFFGDHAHLADTEAFAAFLAPLKRTRWFVYSKRPFAGPKAVLAYLARYTHRVAISNRRLIAADEESVTFKVKDYRVEGPGRCTTMTLATDEFVRRFLIHVLPKGFHRIRHYGLLARGPARSATIERARELIAAAATPEPEKTQQDSHPTPPSSADKPADFCPCCGAAMVIIETFEGCMPRHRPTASPTAIRIDTS